MTSPTPEDLRRIREIDEPQDRPPAVREPEPTIEEFRRRERDVSRRERGRKPPTKLAPGLASPPRPPAPGVMPDEPLPPFDVEQPPPPPEPPSLIFRPEITPEQQQNIDDTAVQIQRQVGASGAPITFEQAQSTATDVLGLAPPGEGTLLGDVVRTILGLGQIPTRGDAGDVRELKQRYSALLGEARDTYERARSEAAREGQSLDETQGEFLARAVPFSETEFVDAVFDSTPDAISLIAQIGLNAIPIYGTARTWDESPNWLRAVGVATDLLFLAPMVGMVSAGVRGGATIGTSVNRTAIATIKSPITVITRPRQAAQAAVDPFFLIGDPRRIPVAATEIRASTVRFPIVSAESKEVGDILAEAAIAGERPVAQLLPGKQIELATTPANAVAAPVAFHTSPDIRFALEGFTVQETREGGMFFAPTAHTRFTTTSAFGDVGQANPMPGAIMIRDEKVLSNLQSSGKTFQGQIEIESILKEGTDIPAPSQLLKMRDASGQQITIAVIGDPLTPTQIAKLKILGTVDTIRDIFRPPVTVSTLKEADDLYTQMVGLAEKSEAVSKEANAAKSTGSFSEARSLETEAAEIQRQADAIAGRLGATIAADVRFTPSAIYTGDQNIEAALGALETGRASLGSEVRLPARAPTIRPPAEVIIPRGEAVRPSPQERADAAIARGEVEPVRVEVITQRPPIGFVPLIVPTRAPEPITPEISRAPDVFTPREDFEDIPIPPPDEPRIPPPEPPDILIPLPPERPDGVTDDEPRIPPPEGELDRPPPPPDEPPARVPPPDEPVRVPPPGIPDTPRARPPSLVEEVARPRPFGPDFQDEETQRELAGLIPVAWRQVDSWIRVGPPYEVANFRFPASTPTGSRFFASASDALAFVDGLVNLSPKAREFWLRIAELNTEEGLRNIQDRQREIAISSTEDAELRSEIRVERSPAQIDLERTAAALNAERSPSISSKAKQRQEVVDEQAPARAEILQMRAEIEAEVLEMGFKPKPAVQIQQRRGVPVFLGRARQRPVFATATEVDFTDEKRKGGFSVRPTEQN